MADTRDSKSRDSDIMRVRVSPAAPRQPTILNGEGCFFVDNCWLMDYNREV